MDPFLTVVRFAACCSLAAPPRYRIQSLYTMKKPLIQTPMALPMDVYKFRYEVDLNPIYIYRLTPIFKAKTTQKPKIVKGSWDDVNALPLEKLNDTLIFAIRLAEDIFEGNLESEHKWQDPEENGKNLGVAGWRKAYDIPQQGGERLSNHEVARLFLMDAIKKEKGNFQAKLKAMKKDKDREKELADRTGSIAAYHICPSDTHFEDEPMIKKGKPGKPNKVYGSAKKLLKNYTKKILENDQTKIDDIFSHLQFGLRLKMLEILKGDSGKGNIKLVTVMPDGMTLKRTKFQPRIKYAMKKRWLKHSKDTSTHPPHHYDFGKALDAYHPVRIDSVMPGFNVLTQVKKRELWPQLSLRQECSEQFIPTSTKEPSQTSLCLELHVSRAFWPVVLAVQLPMWTVLLLVPFAWEFLRTKAEQGFFEAYGYLAALLLTAVAHRSVVDTFTEKISGLTWFDLEFSGVLFMMMVTWIGVAMAISYGHSPDGELNDEGEEDDEMGNMFKENYYGFLRTIFFVQLGVYFAYVSYQIMRLVQVEMAFSYAQPDALANRGLQDMHIDLSADIVPAQDRPKPWWKCTEKKSHEYIHQRHELLTQQ